MFSTFNENSNGYYLIEKEFVNTSSISYQYVAKLERGIVMISNKTKKLVLMAKLLKERI